MTSRPRIDARTISGAVEQLCIGVEVGGRSRMEGVAGTLSSIFNIDQDVLLWRVQDMVERELRASTHLGRDTLERKCSDHLHAILFDLTPDDYYKLVVVR